MFSQFGETMKTLTLIYQFAYYWIIERNRHKPAWLARQSALIAIGVVETYVLASFGALYNIIAISHGAVIHRSYLTRVQMLPYGILYFAALIYVNAKIFASSERVARYKELFDSWDKRKRTRWKIYVVSFAVMAFVVFVLLANQSRQILQP